MASVSQKVSYLLLLHHDSTDFLDPIKGMLSVASKGYFAIINTVVLLWAIIPLPGRGVPPWKGDQQNKQYYKKKNRDGYLKKFAL